jgi:hypothetical protein
LGSDKFGESNGEREGNSGNIPVPPQTTPKDKFASKPNQLLKSREQLVPLWSPVRSFTNHIVEHVFVDISRSQGFKKTTCQNEKRVYFSRVRTEKRKENKRHR